MVCARKLTFCTSALILVGTQSVFSASHPESCDRNSGSIDAGLSLLQTGSKRKLHRSAHQDVPVGTARGILPPHLFQIGLQLLQKEEILDAIVANTKQTSLIDAGANVTFRIGIDDRIDGVQAYGIDRLGSDWMKKQLEEYNSPMMNMLDIGGNLGRVTISAFMNYPYNMRIVVVEPVPITFFLLKWNLWLNGIQELTQEEFQSQPMRAGVLALHQGLASVDGQTLGMCYNPPYTMTARICDCTAEAPRSDSLQKGEMQCLPMIGHTVHFLLSLFNNQTIAFLKMDCEGCEYDAIPDLAKSLASTGQHVVRFAGELHEATNELEDFACKFEDGRWFAHVCHMMGTGYQTVELPERCQQGPGRASCVRKAILESGKRAGGDLIGINLFERARS